MKSKGHSLCNSRYYQAHHFAVVSAPEYIRPVMNVIITNNRCFWVAQSLYRALSDD